MNRKNHDENCLPETPEVVFSNLRYCQARCFPQSLCQCLQRSSVEDCSAHPSVRIFFQIRRISCIFKIALVSGSSKFKLLCGKKENRMSQILSHSDIYFRGISKISFPLYFVYFIHFRSTVAKVLIGKLSFLFVSLFLFCLLNPLHSFYSLKCCHSYD